MGKVFTLKVSPQGQITLPRDLREHLRVRPGSRVTVVAGDKCTLQISGKTAIEKHFGRMPSMWTKKGQDAAEYTRKLRSAMQPKQGPSA